MPDQETAVDYADGALRLTRIGPVATIRIDRTHRKNAISRAMWQALPDIVAAIDGDERIRVVIVRGTGDAFSAGADIGEFVEVYADAASTSHYNATVRAGQAALRALPRPTIALIEGVCVGGGCGLALACDLRFASTGARFAITPARLGLAYSFADTAQLVEKVGPARAKDILFSGRMLEAGEARSIGLVDRLCSPADLEAEVMAYADNLAVLSRASIRIAKQTINAIVDEGGVAAARFTAVFEESFSSDDFREGYSAFVEKRTPRFV